MKASALILGVVADARKLDRDTYVPKSDTWHSPEGRCGICFGGVWLTQRYLSTQLVGLAHLNQEQANTVVFLDRLRLRDFDGIRNFANGARIDDPDGVEATLQALKRDRQPAFWNYHCPDFFSWKDFDQVLTEMEQVGKALAARNL